MDKRGGDEVHGKDGACRNEREEVSVISAAHAVVEPYAMVIMSFDAVIAEATVVSPRWPPDIAGAAMFNRHLHRSGCPIRRTHDDPVVGWGSEMVGIVVFPRGKLMQISGENLGKH